MTVTLKCELFFGLLTRQKIIRSQCRLRCPMSVHAAGLHQFNAAGIDDCEVRRTARQSGEATYLVRASSFCSEIWREIQAQKEKIGWPLISQHSCRGLPIGYPSSQDAGLIATRELSVGEPIPIVQRAQSFVMASRRSVTSSKP